LVPDSSRAADVLAAVLQRLPSKFVPDVRVLDSWVEDDDVICLVYTSSLTDGLTGLRRRVEVDIPVTAIVDDIVVCDLGEPLGTDREGGERDENGILWWPGIRPELRYFAHKARGH
jgi:hypothetical protein